MFHPPFLSSSFTAFGRPQRLVHFRARTGAEDNEEAESSGFDSGLGQSSTAGGTRIAAIEVANFSPEVKRMGRSAAYASEPLLHSYLDGLLQGTIKEEAFKAAFEAYEKRERNNQAWETIFDHQRETRNRINELHEYAQAYTEAIPSESIRVKFYLDQLHSLNNTDAKVDGELKQILDEATKPIKYGDPDPITHVAPTVGAALTTAQAKTLFYLDPSNATFDSQFRTLLAPFGNIPLALRTDPRVRQKLDDMRAKLIELKSQERLVERKFKDVYEKVHRLVENNLSKATRVAEQKRMKDIASRTTGITVEAGTVIKYTDKDFLGIGGRTSRVTISAVTFDQVPIRDHNDKIIGQINGCPIVHIDGVKMTPGRFKKWVDATNAVEEITGQQALEQKIGWAKLGLHLKPGTELEYQVLRRMKDGSLKREPQKVIVSKVEAGNVHFASSVTYQSSPSYGDQSLDEPESRDSLEFGEFAKWYARNETEKAFSMEELRKALKCHNEDFNHVFQIDQSANPAIEVAVGELLYYPDGSGLQFGIKTVTADKIGLDTGKAYTPAQFFYWVRHNNVQKDPSGVIQGAKIPEEIELERKRDIARKLQEERLHRYIEEKKEEDEKSGHVHIHEDPNKKKTKKEEEDEKLKKMEEAENGPPEARSHLEFVRRAWNMTTFLSFKDIWHMVVAVKDFVVRRHERRSKERYSEAGRGLPGLIGAEFQKIHQAAEDEEVHQFMEPMKHMDIFDVKRMLHQTNNKDVAKACIESLIEKGEMRFDDHHLHATLNRLTGRYTTRSAELFITHGVKMGVGNPEDQTGPAMDALWGQGTASEWFQKNVSTYSSQKKNFDFKGNQLEADPKGTGGLAGELRRLLGEWKAGKYVNPMEYEGLIEFGIVKGKMTGEEKIFFLIMGVITKNKNMGGESLLHIDRIGQLDGEHLNRFPLLDFFTNKDSTRPDSTPEHPNKGPWRIQDYEAIAKIWFPDDADNNKAGPQIRKFIWQYMLFDDAFRIRLSKGLRNADQMDHDDAHMFIPPASEEEIEKITDNFAGGSKTYFTSEGYANAYPGFSQYVLAIASKDWRKDEGEKRSQALRDAIRSFVRYDAILDNRYLKKEGSKRARLSEHHYNRGCVVDRKTPIKLHQKQMQNVVLNIGRAYGRDLSDLFKKTGSLYDPNDAKEQKRLEQLHQEFSNVLAEMLIQDDGKKAIEEILKANHRAVDSETGLKGLQLDKA